jgi:hypothetical protein
MNCTIVPAAVVVLLFCALCAGCTSPTDARIKPFETTVPAQPQATQSASAVTVTPSPQTAETLPYEQNVEIHVEKQRPDASIHLLYYGGQGEAYVQNIMMRVTRPDGTVAEKYLSDGLLKPRRYDELVMDGSRGIDQVAVFITSMGKTYKVYDSPLAYPQF